MKKRVNRKSTEEKKEEKKYYQILVGLAIYGVAYHKLLKPLTIGHDIWYNIFIIWIPAIVGLLLIGIYRQSFLSRILKTCSSFLDKILTTLFLILMGLIFSYLSFGVTTNAIWNWFNSNYANKAEIEIYY